MTAERVAKLEIEHAEMKQKQNRLEETTNEVLATLNNVGKEMAESTRATLENTIEQRHSREAISRMHGRMDKIEDQVEQEKIQSAKNQPAIDTMKLINNRVWFLLIGTMFTSITMIAGLSYAVSTGALK